MGLWDSEMEGILSIMSQLQAGKISCETYSKLIDGYTQIQKRSENYLKVVYLDAKFRGRPSKKLAKMNLFDYDNAINLLVDPETEKLRCPIEDEPITRAACLDFSGSHPEDCNGCENKVITQNKLLGEKP